MATSAGRTLSAARGVIAGSRKRVGGSAKADENSASAAAGSGYLAKISLKRSGGSLVMIVPASARNLLGLYEGQEMAVSVEGSKVIAEPVPISKPMRVRRPKYTLQELVAEHQAKPRSSKPQRAWMDTPPAGRETW